MITEVSPTATVVLDGSGNGQVSLGPPSGTKWALRLATLATSTSSKQPQAKLYRGSSTGPIQLLDNTFTGAAASSAKVGGAIYYPGQLLWAVWTGGDPGATATLQAFGQQGNRSDPLPPSPLGEGFANPIVSQLIAGSPGGPEIVIGVSPIPAELVTYYASAPLGTNPETIVGATLYYDGAGNYAYQALVIDSSAPHITSLATGAAVAGVVNEASRFALNPGVVLGNARFQQFFEENIVIGTSVTGTNTVFAAQAPTDAFHRLSISRDGVIGFGGGAVLTDAFLDRVGVGELRAANRLDVIQFGALTDTALAVGLSSEANQRLFVRASGEIRGADGTNASDVTFSRSAAGVWVSDRIVANISGVAETAHAFPYAGAWADFGGTTRALTYEKLVDGRVHLVGVAKSPNPFTNLIGTLPVGYRPTAEIGGVGLANTGGGGLVQVLANGQVNVFLVTVNNEWWIDILIPTN